MSYLGRVYMVHIVRRSVTAILIQIVSRLFLASQLIIIGQQQLFMFQHWYDVFRDRASHTRVWEQRVHGLLSGRPDRNTNQHCRYPITSSIGPISFSLPLGTLSWKVPIFDGSQLLRFDVICIYSLFIYGDYLCNV